MKPSVWVQIDPDDEILEGDSVSQRVGNYLPDSRWRKRYQPTDWPVLKLWRRSAVAAPPWECQEQARCVIWGEIARSADLLQQFDMLLIRR
jgi:hypothetical protein